MPACSLGGVDATQNPFAIALLSKDGRHGGHINTILVDPERRSFFQRNGRNIADPPLAYRRKGAPREGNALSW
jgi:hypothetical protein